MTFQEFFNANRSLFYSLSGQVFFVLGLTIALSARHDTKIPLARSFWLLSAFGFSHAFYEWSYIILPVQKAYLSVESYRLWEILQRVLEALSFAFLFQFGISVMQITRPSRWLSPVPWALFALWLSGFLYALPPPSEPFRTVSDLSDVWARYLLCFPGGCLAAYGLMLQTKQAKSMGVQQIATHLKFAAVAFLMYAVVAGLFVPPASFFPASWLNRRLLSTYLGIPSPMIRAAAGLLITYFMIRSLDIFKVESRRMLEEAGRIRALAEDRERISRDLHDGILQHLYGAGLHLENALASSSTDSDAARGLLQKSIQLLNRGMQEIRNYVFDLNWDTKSDLESKVRDLLVDHPGSKLDSQLEVSGLKHGKLAAGAELHVYHFVQEAVGNARKHAHAGMLKVTVAADDKFLSVKVEDDGVGFVAGENWLNNGSSQQGLRNMKRRAELLGGQLAIRTGPDSGTIVTLTVPLERDLYDQRTDPHSHSGRSRSRSGRPPVSS